MKKRLLICNLCLAAALLVHGQGVNQVMILKQERMNQVNHRIQFSKKDANRMALYSAMSQYMVESNIYPNQDAIDLLYAYNKDVPNEEILNKPQSFKTLAILKEPVNKTARLAMITQVSPVIRENNFRREADIFQTKLATLQKMPAKVTGGFRDSLSRFRVQVLPSITANLPNIEFAQIDYFTNSLHDINQWLDEYAADSGQADAILAIEGIMYDFFVYPVKAQNSKSQIPVHNFQHKIISKSQKAVSVSFSLLASTTGITSLPNADIYVYTRDKSGHWDQKPKKEAFDVYFDHNAVQYRLKPGCDTISLFRSHPSVPASVLPVLLPEGNLCFLLRDLSNGRLYVRPNINLTDNSVIDDNKLIKLCFKAEN